MLERLPSIEDFQNIEIRVGTVIEAEEFPQARKPAYRLTIDFGDRTLRSSAQITVHYTPDTLVGRQVLAATNLPPRQIGPFISECLVLGLTDEGGAVVLVEPERPVPNGVLLH